MSTEYYRGIIIRTARTDKGYATKVSSGFMRHQCLTALAPWITVPPTLASPVMYGRPSRSQSAPMTESIDRQLVSGCDAHSPVSAVNAVRHVRLVALWHASGRASAYIYRLLTMALPGQSHECLCQPFEGRQCISSPQLLSSSVPLRPCRARTRGSRSGLPRRLCIDRRLVQSRTARSRAT